VGCLAYPKPHAYAQCAYLATTTQRKVRLHTHCTRPAACALQILTVLKILICTATSNTTVLLLLPPPLPMSPKGATTRACIHTKQEKRGASNTHTSTPLHLLILKAQSPTTACLQRSKQVPFAFHALRPAANLPACLLASSAWDSN
jgi:hypothetical protein